MGDGDLLVALAFGPLRAACSKSIFSCYLSIFAYKRAFAKVFFRMLTWKSVTPFSESSFCQIDINSGLKTVMIVFSLKILNMLTPNSYSSGSISLIYRLSSYFPKDTSRNPDISRALPLKFIAYSSPTYCCSFC